ncbi:Cilia- and flagella-associated protein 53 [Schistosoma haematobium]|nr:Cilia- and flagella-associated protein 53 [Schistosoma haematobium]KAH9590457.1 Cilia- and flagella-associated protein 53 [Schistosoma haematobium]
MYEEEISRSIDEHIAKQQNLGHHKKMQLLVARENLKNDVNEVCRQQIMERRKRQDEEKLEHIEVKQLNEVIERMKLDSKYELQLRRQNVETYRNALERQIADQRTRYQQLIADNAREFEKNKKTEEQLTELVHNIVNSNETDYNRHLWQKLLTTGHWSIPVWDGEPQISKFASARY